MKSFTKTLLASAIVAASSMGATVANAEVEVAASVGVSNMYLWRGFDLGDGSGAIYGDLVASVAGAYAGVWASSGDDGLGNEYDLFVGYGGEVGSFSYDLMYVTYLYPEAAINADAGEFADLILSVGFGPISLSYYDAVGQAEGADEAAYYTIAGAFGDFELKYGAFNEEGGETAHLDLTYSYNDNLSFTVSKIVDDGIAEVETDPLFAFNLSLPIE